MRFAHILVLLYLGLAWIATDARAQSLRLQQAGTGETRVQARLGDTLSVEIAADLGDLSAAGTSVFISIPDGPFQVLDADPARPGVQPFVQRALFSGAAEFANLLVALQQTPAPFAGRRLLDYAAVAKPRVDRERTGTGPVAAFRLLCIREAEEAWIAIDDNPVRETRLMLTDGVTELPYQILEGMHVTVRAIDLKDIPDVLLLPGQSDNQQIGRLDRYVLDNRTSPNFLRWSFAGEGLDSLRIQIDPFTRRVTITPLHGWIGRRRITWTVAEPRSPLPPEPPPSASDISDVIVNTPPRFRVRRDTVLLVEDQHTFLLPMQTEFDPARAFQGTDLDLLVDDPDVADIHAAFQYAVLTFRAAGDTLPRVRARVARGSNHLLLWSRPEFSGVDSLRVVVADEFTVGRVRGQDTLRVTVFVEEAPDPPRFVLAERQLRLRQGGSKTMPLAEIVADPDTPLDSLQLAWEPDPAGNFTAERQGDLLIFRAPPDFAGQGLFAFTVADPDGLQDRMEVRVRATAPFPPRVFPRELKVALRPSGPAFTTHLDGLVEDLDDADPELVWSPPSSSQNRISIDPVQTLSVEAPQRFIGYEGVFLYVADPDALSDSLKLRIYSSAGSPVAGGLPDLFMEPGEVLTLFDLDDYYYDGNDGDDRVRWEVSGYQQVGISIDPLTHVATFALPDSAVQGAESLLFQVITPDGRSARDTLLLTIGPQRIAGFRLTPLPPLRIEVDEFRQVLELDAFVQTETGVPRPALTWGVRTLDVELNALISITTAGGVRLYGHTAGVDTVAFVAIDDQGRQREARTTVEVVDPLSALRLRPLPDVEFVAGYLYTGLDLDEFVVDRRTHPDSLLRWSVRFLATTSILVQVQDDHSVHITASGPIEADVVFIASNPVLRTSARDTVRITVLDPARGRLALAPLPSITLALGQLDTSVYLDNFLSADLPAAVVRWSVSGQTIVSSTIGSAPPHPLRLESTGTRVGLDTLHLTAHLGRGFLARGDLRVAVVEPVNENALRLELVPHPLQLEFVDAFVVARQALASPPELLYSFAGVEQAVPLRALETDLEQRGVLIWSGDLRLPRNAGGLLSFSVAARTQPGTPLRAVATLSFARARVGKVVTLRQQGLELSVPIVAKTAADIPILMRVENRPGDHVAGLPTDGELRLVTLLQIHPGDLPLEQPAGLFFEQIKPGNRLYRKEAEQWRYVAAVNGSHPVLLDRLGQYALLRDERPPRISLLRLPETWKGLFVADLEDKSGIDAEHLRFSIDGVERQGCLEGSRFFWSPEPFLLPGRHQLGLQVRDNAGNESFFQTEFVFTGLPLPDHPVLEANYPNPFNPRTVISFWLPTSLAQASIVRLLVYNAAGQLVRELPTGGQAPGYHAVVWDGRDTEGRPVATGIYIYLLETDTATSARRMTLAK